MSKNKKARKQANKQLYKTDVTACRKCRNKNNTKNCITNLVIASPKEEALIPSKSAYTDKINIKK